MRVSPNTSPTRGNIVAPQLALSPAFSISSEAIGRNIAGKITHLALNGDIVGTTSFLTERNAKVLKILKSLTEAEPITDALSALEAHDKLLYALTELEAENLSLSSSLGQGAIEIASEYGDQVTESQPVSGLRALVTANEISAGIWAVVMPTRYFLSSTFLRFQEHYESPEFQGKIFDLPAFKDWYRRQSSPSNCFSYYQDWGGYNVPGQVLAPFRAGHFNPLSRKEQAFLETIGEPPAPFYLIGVSQKDWQDSLRHETAHALYAINLEYRGAVDEVLHDLPLAPLFEYFRRLTYRQEVLLDEAQAHLVEPLSFLAAEGIEIAPFQAAHRKLLRIFRRYVPAELVP